MEEMHRARYVGKNMELPCHLNYKDMLIKLHFQLLSPPQMSGSGTESSNPLIMWLAPLVTRPHF